MNHPNALVTVTAGSAGGAIVLALLTRAGVNVDEYEAGLIFTAVSAVVLFVGRNGFEGVWNLIRHGSKA